MKKALFTAVLMSLVIGISWAGDGKFGEISLKVTYDLEGDLKGNSVFEADEGAMSAGVPSGNIIELDNTEVSPVGSGLTLGAEYLYALPFTPSQAILDKGFFKIGLGIQYVFPRKAYEEYAGGSESGKYEYSLLPLYGIIQIHPSKVVPELFLRGVVGYTVLLTVEQKPEMPGVFELGEKRGGLHWGIAAGYEFSWGLFAEYSYSQSNFSNDVEYSPAAASMFGFPKTTLGMDLSYARSSFTIGYKIKL
jgi:hypothetical protein